MFFFAQRRNEAINNWLSQNPMVLGLGALALGAVLIGFSIAGLMTGETHDKRGRKMEGSTAKTMSIIRLVFGIVCVLFGLYKIVMALV